MHPDPPGDDLFAINIQRGRDQGTPPFNKWREFCGLTNMTFDDFGNYSSKLSSVYAYVLIVLERLLHNEH